MIRVLIADDHAVVRHGIRQILADEPDMRIFGEARDGAEALDQIRKHDWDLVILDINMPGPGALDILKEVREARPKLPVLVFSMHPEEQFALRTLKGGASGYLIKESASEELVRAIRKILKGGKYVSEALAEKIAFDLHPDWERAPHENLSNREFQILCLIAAGKTVSEIARELHLSVKTVSTYRARILEKMHMKTNAALAHYAITNRLV